MDTLEKNQNKVIDTKSLLLEVIKEPLKFKDNEALRSSLKSQGGLARFIDNERGIPPCSLNTFKSASDSLFDRGFTEVDELRKNAKNTIEEAIEGSKASKSTRTNLRQQVDDLKLELSVMKKSNYLLTVVISELRGELKRMSESSDDIGKRQHIYQDVSRKVEVKLNYTLHGKA